VTGNNKLKEELTALEKEAEELTVRVAEAREMGDLKENGEYIYGRQNLGFVEGRMGEIRGKLNNSEVVDCTKVSCDTIAFGTVVTLMDLDSKKEIIFQLLGSYDYNLIESVGKKVNRVSLLSPIGEGLVGHAVGDKFTVTVPRGDMNYEVLNISVSEFE